MPESHLGWRGDFIPRKNETVSEINARKEIWLENQEYLVEWNRLFDQLGESREEFIKAIGDNSTTTERFLSLENITHKKLFIHYFTMTTLLKTFAIENENEINIVIDYITNEFPLMYKRLIRYISQGKIPHSFLLGIVQVMGETVVKDIVACIDYDTMELPFVINNLSKVQSILKKHFFDFELVKCFFMYTIYKILNRKEKNQIVQAIQNLDERKARELLLVHYNKFEDAIKTEAIKGEVGAEYILNEIDKQLTNVYKQLSLFDI